MDFAIKAVWLKTNKRLENAPSTKDPTVLPRIWLEEAYKFEPKTKELKIAISSKEEYLRLWEELLKCEEIEKIIIKGSEEP